MQAGIYKTSVCGSKIINHSRSGSSGHPITWTFEDNVVFLNDDASFAAIGVYVKNGDNYVTDLNFNFKNAVITDMGRGAFEIYRGTRITIDGSQSSPDWYNIQNAGSEQNYPGIWFSGDSQNCTVTKMHLLECSRGITFGVSTSTATEPTICSVVECLVAYSDGFDDPGSGDGFQAVGRNCHDITFTKCVAIYCSDDGFDLGQGAHDCTLDRCVGAYSDPESGEGDGAGIKVGTYPGDDQIPGGGFEMENCVAFGNTGRGMESFGYRPQHQPTDDNVFKLCVSSWNGLDQFYTERGDIQLRKVYACRQTDSGFWTARQKVVGTIHEYSGDFNWLVGVIGLMDGWKDGNGNVHSFEGDTYDTNPYDDSVNNWSVNVSRIGPGSLTNNFAKVTGPVMPWTGP